MPLHYTMPPRFIYIASGIKLGLVVSDYVKLCHCVPQDVGIVDFRWSMDKTF